MSLEYLSTKCSIFFEEYGKRIIIGLAILVIILALGLGFAVHQKSIHQKYSDELLNVLALSSNAKETQGRLKNLTESSKVPANIRRLAKLQLAKNLFTNQQIAESQKLLVQLSQDTGADKFIRDLAIVSLANQFMLTNDQAALEKLLTDNNSYKLADLHDVANEQIVFIYWKNKRYTEAMEMVDKILGDPDTSSSVRLRLQQLQAMHLQRQSANKQ